MLEVIKVIAMRVLRESVFLLMVPPVPRDSRGENIHGSRENASLTERDAD